MAFDGFLNPMFSNNQCMYSIFWSARSQVIFWASVFGEPVTVTSAEELDLWHLFRIIPLADFHP